MALISDEDKKVISDMFSSMTGKTKIAFFTDEQDEKCAHCKDTQNILEELSSVSDKIELQVFNYNSQKDKAQTLGIDKIPAIALLGENEEDYGIRFFGVPAGYEFGTLIEDIVMIGKKDSGLAQESKDKLKSITKKTHVQVFVTPT